MNEPKWTTHRVTMPEDMALEYLDKLLVVVNKQFLDPGYPIALSMAIDKMRTPSPDNKALTDALSYREFMPMEVTEDGERFCPRCQQEIVGYYTEYCEHCGQAVESPPEKGELTMECGRCEHYKAHNCKHQCMDLPDGETCADCMHIEKCVQMFHGNPGNTRCGFEPIRFKNCGRDLRGESHEP